MKITIGNKHHQEDRQDKVERMTPTDSVGLLKNRN